MFATGHVFKGLGDFDGDGDDDVLFQEIQEAAPSITYSLMKGNDTWSQAWAPNVFITGYDFQGIGDFNVPEPTTMGLVGAGALLALFRRRR